MRQVFKMRQLILLQSATAFLLQRATSVITKCDSFFVTKCDKCYYKVRQVLQSATILFQSAKEQWSHQLWDLSPGSSVESYNPLLQFHEQYHLMQKSKVTVAPKCLSGCPYCHSQTL